MICCFCYRYGFAGGGDRVHAEVDAGKSLLFLYGGRRLGSEVLQEGTRIELVLDQPVELVAGETLNLQLALQ